MPFDGVPLARRQKRRARQEALLILRVAMFLVERGWSRGSFASWGPISVQINSPWARRFCSVGAVDRAVQILQLHTSHRYRAYKAVAAVIPIVSPGVLADSERLIGSPTRMIRWNDRTSKRVVLEGFAMAIAQLESQEGVQYDSGIENGVDELFEVSNIW